MPRRPAGLLAGGQGVRSDPESEGFEEKYRAVIEWGRTTTLSGSSIHLARKLIGGVASWRATVEPKIWLNRADPESRSAHTANHATRSTWGQKNIPPPGRLARVYCLPVFQIIAGQSHEQGRAERHFVDGS
jgi:hypothetical protein